MVLCLLLRYSADKKRNFYYLLFLSRYLKSAWDSGTFWELSTKKKKIGIKETKKTRRSKALTLWSSSAGLLDFFWVIFLAIAVGRVTLHRPRWPSTISNRQSKRKPLISSSSSPRSSHLLLCRCAHLFILNPVIIVPLHWPAGKAPAEVGELIERVSLPPPPLRGRGDWLALSGCSPFGRLAPRSLSARRICLDCQMQAFPAEDVLSGGLHLSIHASAAAASAHYGERSVRTGETRRLRLL